MRRRVHSACLALALALASGAAVPGRAQTAEAKDASPAQSCAGLAAPLERRMEEARPRLEKMGRVKEAQAAQSRLLSEVMSGDDAREALAAVVACLAGQRG